MDVSILHKPYQHFTPTQEVVVKIKEKGDGEGFFEYGSILGAPPSSSENFVPLDWMRYKMAKIFGVEDRGRKE